MRNLWILLIAGVSNPALGQDGGGGVIPHDPPPETQITVLADGVRTRTEQTGQAITVFDQASLDRVQGADLGRTLERAPGVAVTRNGGLGGFTAVRLRGAEGEQTLVVIDGVRAADPAAPGGGFDFGSLLAGNLAKVEVQRSSNSTIWGSDAIGGVIAVTTGGPRGYRGTLEYGANRTVRATAGADVAAGSVELALAGGHFGSRGFSAAAGGTEPDGFRQDEVTGRIAGDIADGVRAFARARWADGRAQTDGFPTPLYALSDTAEYQDTRQRTATGGAEIVRGALGLTAAASLARTDRANFDPDAGPRPTFTSHGASDQVEVRGRFGHSEGLALDFGAEHQWTRYRSLFDSERRTAISGAYGQLGWNRGAIHLAAGLRRDQHVDFGGHWSAGADGALVIHAVRVTASYGEGFKAPSLFQLHSDYGNAALRPETSRSMDAGIGATLGGFAVKATAFQRDTSDLIQFVSCFGQSTGICDNRPFGTYRNVGRARARGVEAEANLTVSPQLSVTAAYTLLSATDRDTGRRLARQPHDTLSASVDLTLGRATFGADVRWVAASFDDAANTVRLAPFVVVTGRAEYALSEAIALYGRIENLLDDHYQTAAGYASPGRSGYVGVRARL